MKDIKIYVVCHKESYIPNNPLFVPIQVGAALTDKRLKNMIADNTGDNISEKNKSYCELTAHYWAWKNDNAEYYGFCHYRRYFSFSDEILGCDNWQAVVRPFLNRKSIDEMQAGRDQVEKRVLPYDVLTPVAIPLKPLGIKSVYEQYKTGRHLHIEDIDLIREIIKDIYPDYSTAADEYFDGNKVYFCNMFIMKKELFHNYCQWLFDILKEFERRSDMSLYSVEGFRTPGHLGERLFGIYITWLKRQQKCKIGELQMMTFGNTDIFKYPSPAFETNNIPIVFSSSEYFAPYCATAIQSIIQNGSMNNNYDFLILEKDIPLKTKNLINRMVEKYPNVSLRFLNVKHIISDYSLYTREHFTIETYFRLLIPELLPEYDKVLYLDGDLIAKTDVAELFNTDIGDNALGAAIDVIAVGHVNGFPDSTDKAEYYRRRVRLKDIRKLINGGVMLINSKRIRSSYSMEELLKFAQVSNFDLADQDCMISLFQDEIYWLDLRWNTNIYDTDTLGYYVASFAPKELFENYMSALKEPNIMHYAGTVKPWHDPNYILSEEFWSVARNTPFYETIMYRRILENIHHSSDILRNELGSRNKRPQPPLPPNRSFPRKAADILFPLYSYRREVLKNIYYSVTRKPRPTS